MVEPSQHWANRIATRLDRMAIWSGRIVGWMIIPMVLGLSYEVISRYVFGAPTIWAYDMTFMVYGTFFMLGAAFTLQRRGHIRTDMFYGEWSARKQAWVDLICYVVFFYPFILILIVYGWGYFWQAFQTNEKFVSSPWMPITWPFKLVLPVTGVLMATQGFSEMLKCIAAIQQNQWLEKVVHHES